MGCRWALKAEKSKDFGDAQKWERLTQSSMTRLISSVMAA
jgi:hypothetical protein